ncbi:MAG: hypothetical protein E6I52_08740 [Chloroflexi bacterium]|nr:MAG: hypothetical protein E6I52_08740 [Chloroflexota bacterium]
MTMLSPAATYHAELREHLDSVGRALSVQRGLLWLTRGLAAGTVVVLGLVIWAWARDAVKTLPIVLLVVVPLVVGLVTAVGSLFIRHNSLELARRIDRAARLHERSTTALELGGRGDEFPLAIAQMRDAVDHLKRVDLLEAFPLRAPKHELMTAFFVVVIAAIVFISPNPWLLRARASNPTITIAREQAQRVQRLADSIQPNDTAELDALRQLLSKGAKTVDARSNEPDAALNALQDLEEQVQQMSAGDDQIAAALAAIASALASDPTTQSLADAINTGDMRQISQAARDLAQSTKNLTSQDQQRVAKVLRDASGRAGRMSQSIASNLSDAANALQAASGADAANAAQAAQGDPSQGGQQSAGGAQAASDALNQLSDAAAGADARQRAASQLQSSRNALERALGRTQSRSGSNSSSGSRSSSGSQGSNGSQNAEQSQGGQGRGGDQPGGGMDGNGGDTPGGDQGNGGDLGQGGGYSTGGDSPNHTGASATQLDAITRPEQVPTNGQVAPDQSSMNPYTSDAGTGNAQTAPESVQPVYSSQPTQGNDSSSIPIGLRDLVKDYFSSLDQK